MYSKVPVLLITFNRPELSLKVLDQIRIYRPDKLYVASDGPREHVSNEKALVFLTREKVLNGIDWDCEVKTLFREENMGCGIGPSSAISWLFEQEEYGIILEDDCVPQPEFFEYCNYLLEKYRDDQRVWIISGRNEHSDSKYFKNQDYLFSNFPSTWGWATWRRCWEKYDIEMPLLTEFLRDGGFKNVQFLKIAGGMQNLKYKVLQRDKSLNSHVWDYQFLFTMNLNRGLAIIPAKNLIENIGYDGTHFSGITKAQKMKSESNYQIRKEPRCVLPNRNYEVFYFYQFMFAKVINVMTRLYRKFVRS